MSTLSARATSSGVERRFYPATFEMRAYQDGTGGSRYALSGYASAYESPYEMWDFLGPYTEKVSAGAGAKTLSENPDVVLLFNHDGMPMARTKATNLRLAEDSTGLQMEAPSLNGGLTIVRDVATQIDEGVLDEMSFAFRIVRQDWSPDYEQRDILEYNINRGDVSVVTFGANPATSVALRAQMLDAAETLEGDALIDAARRFATRLQRAATPLPADVTALLAQILGKVAAVDNIVDELQEQIADELGVPNPDLDSMDDAARAAAVARVLRAQDEDFSLLRRSA